MHIFGLGPNVDIVVVASFLFSLYFCENFQGSNGLYTQRKGGLQGIY